MGISVGVAKRTSTHLLVVPLAMALAVAPASVDAVYAAPAGSALFVSPPKDPTKGPRLGSGNPGIFPSARTPERIEWRGPVRVEWALPLWRTPLLLEAPGYSSYETVSRSSILSNGIAAYRFSACASVCPLPSQRDQGLPLIRLCP